MKKNIYIDTNVGGLGDVWMRLTAFYSFAYICSDYTLYCKVPPSLRSMATIVFGDRIHFVTEDSHNYYTYTSRGFLDLWRPILKGKKFISPYHRVKHAEGKGNVFKKTLNNLLINTCNYLGYINLPRWESLNYYQGYMEAEAIPEFKSISYQQFLSQSSLDFALLQTKLKLHFSNLPVQGIPDLSEHTVVFPSGTAHQFMPLEFALVELPQALYFFHAQDPDQHLFKDAGLQVYVFNRAEEIAAISLQAKTTIATDSFPSHIVQYCPSYSILALAEVPGARTVNPHYTGCKIESLAPCSPCLHLEKKGFPLCDAGYASCLTWKQEMYVQQIKKSIK